MDVSGSCDVGRWSRLAEGGSASAGGWWRPLDVPIPPFCLVRVAVRACAHFGPGHSR